MALLLLRNTEKKWKESVDYVHGRINKAMMSTKSIREFRPQHILYFYKVTTLFNRIKGKIKFDNHFRHHFEGNIYDKYITLITMELFIFMEISID